MVGIFPTRIQSLIVELIGTLAADNGSATSQKTLKVHFGSLRNLEQGGLLQCRRGHMQGQGVPGLAEALEEVKAKRQLTLIGAFDDSEKDIEIGVEDL